ncbi:MAG TPA: hypothetical protein VLB44_07010 [Kofleriaceae bacterium]|nr:hypothetical protein [Kofleriaceae bacterium]
MREVFVLVAICSLGCGRFGFGDDQAGDGGTVPRSCVSQFTAFGDPICYLRPDGQVWCWGDNSRGQLGDGTLTSRLTPGPSQITDAVAIDSGEFTACAIRRDRTLACWGENTDGQVGDGSGIDRELPAAVNLRAGVAAVRGGELHTCAALEDGSSWCWGANASGQLAQPAGADRLAPIEVSTIGGSLDFTIGDEFTCVLRTDRTVWCIGMGLTGELGDGLGTSRSTFAPVAAITDPVVQLKAGCHRHICAVTAVGDVWCWGDNTRGQVGTGVTSAMELTPRRVAGVTGAVQVAVGYEHSCARTATDEVWCWGTNTRGQLGTGGFLPSLAPARVAGLTGHLVDFQAGCVSSYVVRDDRTLVAWGAGDAIGTGSTLDQPSPVEVALPCP